jgi:hypothetical protein
MSMLPLSVICGFDKSTRSSRDCAVEFGPIAAESSRRRNVAFDGDPVNRREELRFGGRERSVRSAAGNHRSLA